jgi:hypothetical protein
LNLSISARADHLAGRSSRKDQNQPIIDKAADLDADHKPGFCAGLGGNAAMIIVQRLCRCDLHLHWNIALYAIRERGPLDAC